MNEPSFLGHTSKRSGPNNAARWIIAAALDLVTCGWIDYLSNANRKWCVGRRGRGYTLREASLDAWRKRRSV